VTQGTFDWFTTILAAVSHESFVVLMAAVVFFALACVLFWRD